MATIVDRDQLVPLLVREFKALDDLCSDFTNDQWESSTCLPVWTVKDILSHVVGTESMLAGLPTPSVDTSHLTHMTNPPAVANESWVESMRGMSGSEVLERFRDVTRRRTEALEASSQADFDKPSWTPAGPDETYGRFMRIRHFDCYLHELDICAAIGAPDRADPDHLSAALAEPESALGYIVGKKAGAPDGASVRIRLTGAVERNYLVQVDGRARVVDAIDGEPTAGITLDAVLFMRLTGGRVDPAAHAGVDVTLEGDQALALRLATNLSFTI